MGRASGGSFAPPAHRPGCLHPTHPRSGCCPVFRASRIEQQCLHDEVTSIGASHRFTGGYILKNVQKRARYTRNAACQRKMHPLANCHPLESNSHHKNNHTSDRSDKSPTDRSDVSSTDRSYRSSIDRSDTSSTDRSDKPSTARTDRPSTERSDRSCTDRSNR